MSYPSSPFSSIFFFQSEKLQFWKTEAFQRKSNILKQFLAEGNLGLRMEFLLRGNWKEPEPSQKSGSTVGRAHRSRWKTAAHGSDHTNRIQCGNLPPAPRCKSPCWKFYVQPTFRDIHSTTTPSNLEMQQKKGVLSPCSAHHPRVPKDPPELRHLPLVNEWVFRDHGHAVLNNWSPPQEQIQELEWHWSTTIITQVCLQTTLIHSWIQQRVY